MGSSSFDPRFKLGVGIAAILAGSLIAGCCGGPFSADGGCVDDTCPDGGCADAAPDAPTDAPSDSPNG